MKSARSKQFKKGGVKSRSGSLNQDPVEVFCRVAPNHEATTYLTVDGDNVVQMSLPENATSYRNGPDAKDVRYTFKHVFDENSTQGELFEKVALHLVSQLIAGKNGLLLAYGVTGSGKTYTMTGEAHNPGIMPRCLELIFQTISRRQARKCTFRPDRMNGFEIMDEEEAIAIAARMETPALFSAKTPKTPRRREADVDVLFTRGFGSHFDVAIDEDNLFSCFVSYVEIYNNNVFDLLDPNEEPITRRMQNHVLREDGNGNMYVHGVTEVEVGSPEEALEVFSRGQGRKTVANTVLNNASSRSHSIFNIRIVQAPLDEVQDDILMQQKLMTVSQLSLVDLAGSERTNRTKTTGQRLREAGNINFSLMTLRKCLEYLRENQLTGSNKMVPYRDSKLTHLFKNYFDGEGAVRMIVCVNPRASDCDETAHALKFAEAMQEVQVTRPVPQRFDIGLTPGGRRRPPLVSVERTPIRPQLPVVPSFPNLMCLGPTDENTFIGLEMFLNEHSALRNSTIADLKSTEEQLRKELLKVDDDSRMGMTLRDMLDLERQKVLNFDDKFTQLTSENIDLTHKLSTKDQQARNLQIKIEELERVNKQLLLDKTKLKERYNQKNERLKKDKEDLEEEYRKRDAAMFRVIDKVETPRIAPRPARLKGGMDTPSTPYTPSVNTQGTLYRPPTTGALRGTPAVSNPRHRRSRSAGGGDKWLDHRPAQPVELSTVFQPNMRRRKSVTKLTDKKDVVNSETTKYCLTTQEQDSEGTLETKLYKGDVVPTCTGGAQVILQDVETLRQTSPRNVTVRKRSTPCEETENRCRMAIEGHSKRPRC